MKRVDGFAAGESPDEGWVMLRVKVRPALAEALKAEAQRESQELHRSVYVSDLVRDGIRLLLQARRINPYGKTKTRFVPSSVSEGKD
tara:strand:+ start:127 stop:387 length:261 start_codon:yes stop_codon:yes gene_type:complete